MTEIEKYHKKLKKLVEQCPKGYKLCYDMMDCHVYVVASDAEFFDNEISDTSAGYAGGGCPKGVPGFNSDTGCDVNKVIGDGVYINMEAVQS
jgi:hypothetical protein